MERLGTMENTEKKQTIDEWNQEEDKRREQAGKFVLANGLTLGKVKDDDDDNDHNEPEPNTE